MKEIAHQMPQSLTVHPKIRPALDPDFLPAALWNRAYHAAVRDSGGGVPLALTLERSDGSVSTFRTSVLPHHGAHIALNQRYTERLLKFLLWQKGGYRVTVGGDPALAHYLRGAYSPSGARAFDHNFMGRRVYGRPMAIEAAAFDAAPAGRETAVSLGRHLDGCRIGFDLGASDRSTRRRGRRKTTLQRGGTPWSPGAQTDPQYHFDGIHDLVATPPRRICRARGCHRRQLRRRLCRERSPRRLALPRGAPSAVRKPRARLISRTANRVGRSAV